MAKKVTLRRRWLGRALRELREGNKYTLEVAAEYLQRTQPTISKIENGIFPIRRPDVVALLDLYNVTDEQARESLLRMSNDAWKSGWWDGYAKDFDQWFVDFVWLEEQATEHRLYDNALLPGLLQTERYARAVNEAVSGQSSHEQIEHLVMLRMKRQELLEREEPPVIRSIIDEAVLRRTVGGAEGMKEQLLHLTRQAERPNVHLRVLTFEGAARTCPTSPINLFTTADPYPDVAYVETPQGSVYVEEPNTEETAKRYAQIWDSALNEADSVAFIVTLSEEMT